MEYGGIIGLVVLILDAWAIISVIQSPSSTGTKIMWALLILILPLIGFLVWLVAGPKEAGGRA